MSAVAHPLLPRRASSEVDLFVPLGVSAALGSLLLLVVLGSFTSWLDVEVVRGVTLAWLLAYAEFPAMLLLAHAYVRRAERDERDERERAGEDRAGLDGGDPDGDDPDGDDLR